MLNVLLKALEDPENYPHPVDAPIRVIETQISWLFLTGEYAYKLKKPVNFGFLDFTTLKQRQYYCEEELRLNQRLAPDIYDTLIGFTGSPKNLFYKKPLNSLMDKLSNMPFE
jgi:aminoglycoside phosphotransferase family enzyme